MDRMEKIIFRLAKNHRGKSGFTRPTGPILLEILFDY